MPALQFKLKPNLAGLKLDKLKFVESFLKKPTVAVEIGNDWLKVLESEHSTHGGLVTKVRFTKLAQIKGPVSTEVSRIFRELKLNTQSVITFIPRHLVTVRILEFPSTDPKEIDDMVSLQVAKQTPYSKEEIVSTHRIIDTEREGYTKVMLVIAQRNIITKRVEALEQAGIKVEKVGLSTESVYNWFRLTHRRQMDVDLKPIALIDIDSNYSDFMVIRKEWTRLLTIHPEISKVYPTTKNNLKTVNFQYPCK